MITFVDMLHLWTIFRRIFAAEKKRAYIRSNKHYAIMKDAVSNDDKKRKLYNKEYKLFLIYK